MTDEQERLTMPGQPPTDEDLRMDAELTRQELARTVAALGDKVDLKARAHDKVEALRHRADELTERLPERVRPVAATAVHRPLIPLLAVVALVLVFRRVSKRR